MSGGRLVFGAGLGYRDVAFKASGTTAHERVQRLEENLEAIKRLWTEDNVSMTGAHFELDGATVSLKPVPVPRGEVQSLPAMGAAQGDAQGRRRPFTFTGF